jgi:hypothetical protein
MQPVPTTAELYARGREYAYPLRFVPGERKGDPPKPTLWHITEAGHKLLGEIMAANAAEAIAAGASTWTRPPSSGRVLPH